MHPIAIILSAIALAITWITDLPAILGAHPWWSAKVVLIGGPIGFVLAWLACRRIPATPRVILFATATALAAAAAFYGKRIFVASYADNTLAGQFWYFGWIGTMAGIAALILTVTAILLRR